MKIESKIFALVLASVLIGTVAINQVNAPRFCRLYWIQTHKFEKGVIAAVEDPENIPESLNAYSLDVQRIFIGDPGLDGEDLTSELWTVRDNNIWIESTRTGEAIGKRL
jgi:hypothetical protein